MTRTPVVLRVVLGTLTAMLCMAGSAQAAVTGNGKWPGHDLTPAAVAFSGSSVPGGGEVEGEQVQEQEAEEREAEPPPLPGEAPTRTSVVLSKAPAEAPVAEAQPLAEAPTAPGEAAAWGQNGNWELGAGYRNEYVDTPAAVVGLSDVKAVASGYHFSLALLNDGTVMAWGGNSFGQLGDGSRENSSQPVPVKGLSGVVAIAAGAAHALALLSNGTVVTWGGNTYGELGNGTTGKGVENGTASTVPVPVKGPNGVVAIAAGGGDDVVLLNNGALEAWGENRAGQLGDGTTVEKDVPTPVRGVGNAKAIVVGGVPSEGGHTLALLNNSTVMAWGGNVAGQLGNGSMTSSGVPSPVKNLSGVVAVSASISHSMALLGDGTIRVWGSDVYHELGAAPEVCKGEPCSKLPIPVSGLGGVTAISAGLRFSLAVRSGKVFAWGANDVGQLGNGSTNIGVTPRPVAELSDVSGISAGEQHSIALLDGSAPAPTIEGAPAVDSITVRWSSSGQANPWEISWRPVQRPGARWTRYVILSPATRAYTVTGLRPGLYEVAVQGNGGRKVVRATPLG